MWQHVQLSEQIRPCDTLAFAGTLSNQPANNNPSMEYEYADGVSDVDAENSLHLAVVTVFLLLMFSREGGSGTGRPVPLMNCATGSLFCHQLLPNWVSMFVGCLTSQQHANASQRRIYSDNCTCCDTETAVSDQTFYLTQSQYTDTGPTSLSTDPITPGA